MHLLELIEAGIKAMTDFERLGIATDRLLRHLVWLLLVHI